MNKAPASLQQLTVVGAVALAHAAGLWALLDPTLRSAAAAPLQQVTTVMLLTEPATATAPPPLLLSPPPAPPPPPRVAPPEVPRQLHSPPPPEQAATALPAPAVEPVPSERPPPISETVRSAAVGALPTSAAEDRASAPPQVSRATSVPRAARHIENVNYLRAPVLEYPSASRRFGEQGRVVLRVLIGPDGHAEKIELHEASAFQRLNEAAMEAARRALYKPYTEDGVAQPAWALVALSFQLRR
jgi:periplasmic protein TonB